VNRTSLIRRLIVGATGLMVGGAAAVALSTPAQAEDDVTTFTAEIAYSDVEFVDICEGTYVYIKSGNVLPAYKWTITAGGEEFWSDTLGPGENTDQAPPLVPADAGEISVDFKFSPDDNWPKTHTWADPGECEEPEPPQQEGLVLWDLDCETITITVTNTLDEEEQLTVVPSVGESVEIVVPAGTVEEPGESDPVSFPAAIGFVVDVQFEGESVIVDGPIEITPEVWEEAGCEEPPGEGGELPVTGNTTMLVAGGAIALLVLGGGLFLVARKRRVTFTA
jgi:LPXTG-motif cell wall-anchored protein